ncbi:MAG: HmuY family protein [Bacteroidales bacterium]|nr:HmuY family protein [Bacteroidales bacterium]
MMKKVLCLLVAVFIIVFSACKKNDSPAGSGETLSQFIDASSSTTWHYFSFKDTMVIGTGEENETDNAAWFARTDWDMAICRYKIRTNSGAATTAGADGGVFTFSSGISYDDITAVPDTAIFATDQEVEESGMGGTKIIVKSKAQVIQYKANEDGSLVMPPVYLQSPIYIFKTADGKNTYKVNFTQYLNESSTSGKVIFDYAILY